MQYGAALVAQEDLPVWPPSSEWAMALMPYVQLGYTFLYYDLFGPLERRLNRALRGRPPAEEPANAGIEGAPAGAAQQAAAAPAEAGNEEQAGGVWDTAMNLGRAALGLFLDWRVEVEIQEEVEFRIGGGGNDQAAVAGHAQGEDHLGDGEDGEDEFQILAGDAAVQVPPPLPPAAAAEQPRQQANQQNQNNQGRDQDQRHGNDNNNNNNDNDAGAGAGAPPETSYLTEIINSVVTSLLFPAISYGMGELIRAAAPKSWVTRPWRARAPTGLLQERWGRSLVGGCLFVVLRDAVTLYTKYRRVQVKANRRVRNVERRVSGVEQSRPGEG